MKSERSPTHVSPRKEEESGAVRASSSAVTVVKVGGSLASDASRLRSLLATLANGAEGRAVIVPGGGPFADAVRASQAELGFSDALAHRLALDAIGRMAEVFSEMEPRLEIVSSVEAAEAHDGNCLWAPIALREGHPDIPESWDVTSDSLALWLATELGAERCVLVKSAPCPAGASPDDLAKLGLVDRAFPDFARAYGGEIVLHGPAAISRPPPHPEVLRSNLEGGLQGSQRHLETSFEAPPRFAPQDEGVGGISGSRSRGHAA